MNSPVNIHPRFLNRKVDFAIVRRMHTDPVLEILEGLNYKNAHVDVDSTPRSPEEQESYDKEVADMKANWSTEQQKLYEETKLALESSRTSTTNP